MMPLLGVSNAGISLQIAQSFPTHDDLVDFQMIDEEENFAGEPPAKKLNSQQENNNLLKD